MVASLAELGIDRSDQVPTQLTDDLLRRPTSSSPSRSGLAFAAPAGVDQQTWDLPNPADWDVDSIRPLRDCTPSCTTSASSVGAGEGRCSKVHEQVAASQSLSRRRLEQARSRTWSGRGASHAPLKE